MKVNLSLEVKTTLSRLEVDFLNDRLRISGWSYYSIPGSTDIIHQTEFTDVKIDIEHLPAIADAMSKDRMWKVLRGTQDYDDNDDIPF